MISKLPWSWNFLNAPTKSLLYFSSNTCLALVLNHKLCFATFSMSGYGLSLSTSFSQNSTNLFIWRRYLSRNKPSFSIFTSVPDIVIVIFQGMLSLVKFSNISSKGIYVSVIASYNQSSSKNSSYSGCLTYGKCACKTRLKYPFIIFPPYLSKFFLYTITIPYFCKNSKRFYKKFIKNLNFLFLS